MCRVMEEKWEKGRDKGRQETQEANARTMLADGILPLEKIAQYAGLPLDEVKHLAAQQH